MKDKLSVNKIITAITVMTLVLCTLIMPVTAAEETEEAVKEENAAVTEETEEISAEVLSMMNKGGLYESIDLNGAVGIDITEESISAYILKSSDIEAEATDGSEAQAEGTVSYLTVSDYDKEEIESNKLSRYGVSFDGQILDLEEGVFVLSGSIDGQIRIKAGKKSETILVLDNLCVNNPADAAISCTKTKDLIILLNEGSENVLRSGEIIEIDELSSALTEEASGGALYSKAQTVITGTGSLNVYGYINNGIHVTKNLTIDSGMINVEALNNGIKVKDTFFAEGGVLSVKAGGNGISAKDEGTTQEETETGSVSVETAEEQSSRAEETETAQSAEAETAAETENAVQTEEEPAGTIMINDGMITIVCYDDGMQALLDLTVNGGYIDITAMGTYNTRGSYTKTRDETFSGKGIKSGGSLSVNGGSTIITAYNDAVHCTDVLTINDGVLSLYCGDDGIHSDKQIDLNGGIINISNSYEGIEANQININDGTITVFAWDDGMNANGGRGFGSRGSRGGQSSSSQEEMPNLIINGGDIYVRAVGDGLDSNGNLIVNGGKTVVDGPTSNWNGALDSGMENGGKLEISGGTIFAGGASGMAESFSSKSEQVSFTATMAGVYEEGTEIRILTAEGEELFSHTPASEGNSIVFSCPQLEKDHTYILMIGEDRYELETSSMSTKANLKKIVEE